MNTTIVNQIKSDSIISKIAEEFPDNKIFVVGGTVRDFLLGKKSYDKDLIICGMEAKEFAEKLHKIFESAYVPLDEENKIYRIVLHKSADNEPQNMIDVTNPIGDSIEQDLRRRDLTINAIAVDIHTGEVLDLFGGISDLQNKLLNYIEEINFVDDPLRLLRVYRFQATLGFELTPETLNAVCKYTDLIQKSAKERINYELMKLFNGDFTEKALLNMNKTWFLEKIFPVVKELKQVPPNTHHHLDLFHHSVETVKQIQILYEQADEQVKAHLNKVDFGGFPRLAHLKLAGFLHDIGKFSTWTIDQDTGRHRFIKHDDVGAKLAKPLLKKLCFSNKQIDYISDLIKNHIYPAQLMTSADVNEKAMTRYLRKLGDNVVDNIILAKADRLSARGEAITEEMVEQNINGLNKLLDFYFVSLETLAPLPKLIDGHDVMQILNIKPSPLLGEILNALHEKQLDGEINTKDEAIKFVKTYNVKK